MKVFFVTCLYPNEYYDDFREWAKGDIQAAANVFQWGVVEGLCRVNADYEVITLPAMPSCPLKCDKMHLPQGDVIFNDKPIGKMLSYCNLTGYKDISMYKKLKRYLFHKLKHSMVASQRIVIMTYGLYPPLVNAVLEVKKKYQDVVVASIVTDLVDDMMNFHSNRKCLKRVQCAINAKMTRKNYKHIDKYVLLSKYMVEKISEAAGRYIVIEGIARERDFVQIKASESVRSLLYTGTLDEFSGVGDLVDAFLMIKQENARLVICGDGPLKAKILDSAAKDTRVDYRGCVSHDEAIRLQRESSVLINPRKPNNSITRYSFPSKTMEYLVSGTPMMGYRLDGIPEEYYEHIYSIEGNSLDYLANRIQEVLFLPQEELDKKAYKAYQFINNVKTSSKQVSRMMEFLAE